MTRVETIGVGSGGGDAVEVNSVICRVAGAGISAPSIHAAIATYECRA
jgi:hypothetical protein